MGYCRSRTRSRYSTSGEVSPRFLSGDYYSSRGESPGRWMGRGLAGLSEQYPGFAGGSAVTEEQMLAPFRVRDGANEFRVRVARAFVQYNVRQGAHRSEPVPAPERARIRTQVAEEMFVEDNAVYTRTDRGGSPGGRPPG